MDSMCLGLDYTRRFGVEIEINSFDGKCRPDDDNKLPAGSEYVADLISKTILGPVELRKWGHTHNNTHWIVKPDSSCGIEVCSPVTKGWYGLKQICQVVESFSRDPKISADSRCSVHLHIDANDMTIEEMANIISYWIKCERVFMDSVPYARKNNKYCMAVGLWDYIQTQSKLGAEDLIRLLGHSKYCSMNTYHLVKGKRASMEFRLAEAEASRNPYLLKNWIRLLLHFVEMSKSMKKPEPYKEGDVWSSWLWLDPKEVFELLGFSNQYPLSEGLKQVRNWFVARMLDNLPTIVSGTHSMSARRFSWEQVKDIASDLSEQGTNLGDALHPVSLQEALYGRLYVI